MPLSSLSAKLFSALRPSERNLERLRYRLRTFKREKERLETGLRGMEAKVAPFAETALSPADGAASTKPSVTVDETLPPLAWIDEACRGRHRFTVGTGVERRPDGIVEGVWAGPFRDLHSALTSETFGSGAWFGPDGPVYLQRSDTREFTFVLRNASTRTDLVSNSLAFLLARSELVADDAFMAMAEAIVVESTRVETARGLHDYEPVMLHHGDWMLMRFFGFHFSFRQDGTLKVAGGASVENPKHFRAYEALLLAKMQTVFDNAADAERVLPLKPIATVSSGYDSTGVAALAARLGVREALTIDVVVKGHDDDGSQIGEALGMTVEACNHISGQAVEALSMGVTSELHERVLEFIATAGIGDDATFLAFESHLAGRLLMTGVGGDGSWGLRRKTDIGLPAPIPFSKSITEYR